MEISRRDFLKLGAAGLASGFVPGKLVDALSAQKEGQDFGRFGRIETENAFYYPFFEIHGLRPNLREEMKDWNIKPVACFYELGLDCPALEFQKDDPSDILIYGGTNKVTREGEIPADFGRVMTDEVLLFYANNNTSVAFEGVNITDKYFDFANKAMLAENWAVIVGSLGIFLKRFIDTKLEGEDSASKKAELPTKAAILASIWAATPNLTNGFGGALERFTDYHSAENIKKAIWGLDRLVGSLHPENMIVFFRNLVMARRLQTLAKFHTVSSTEKPNISFVAGFVHTGIMDLLTLGEGVAIAAFNLYPTEVLKHIVDANGGVDAFCSMVEVSVKEALVNGQKNKNIILDQGLKDYLEARFGQTT